MNRQTALVAGVVVASFCAFLFGQSRQESPESSMLPAGRFQLFEGKFSAIVVAKDVKPGNVQETGLFRIDTITGRTCRLNVFANTEDHKYSEQWIEISEK